MFTGRDAVHQTHPSQGRSRRRRECWEDEPSPSAYGSSVPLGFDTDREFGLLHSRIPNDDRFSAAPNLTPEVFKLFVSAVENGDVSPTTDTFDALEELSTEFGFRAFTERIATFRESLARGAYADSEARDMIRRLEVRLMEQDMRLAELDQQLIDVRRRLTEQEDNSPRRFAELRGDIAKAQDRAARSVNELQNDMALRCTGI
jgi:hypothetical protein